MRLSDAGLRQRRTRALYPNHRLPPWPNEDAPRDRSNRLLAFCVRRQFFAHNFAHLFRCERLLRDTVMRPERIVDQRLISLSRAVSSQPKAIKHFIIQVNRNACFSLGRDNSTSFSFRKVIFLFHKICAPWPKQGEPRLIGFPPHAPSKLQPSMTPESLRQR